MHIRNLREPVVRRGTKPEAETEAERLRPAARRMGYDVEVRGTMRRHGLKWYEERPYGVYLVLHKPEKGSQRPSEGTKDPGRPVGGNGATGAV